MGVEAETLVGWLITIAIAIIGWLIYRLTAAIKTNNDLLKEEIKEVKEDAGDNLAAAKASYKNMGERLDKDIRGIRDSVVFKDVFEQHEKLEEMREKNFKQMYTGVTDQLSGLNRKLDTLIERALNSNGGG